MEMKKNNKGFSLVELIIVIAIMAVLMAVLAPQFLRYIERSRLQSDNSAIAEIARAMEIAAADEAVTAQIVGTGTAGVVYTGAGAANATKTFTFATSALGDEVSATVGATVQLDSNTYTTAAAGPSIRAVSNGGVVTVEIQNFYNEPIADGGALITAWTRVDAMNTAAPAPAGP